MEDTKLRDLVLRFRKGIERAEKEGYFNWDCRFGSFPRGCCDDTCYLLSEFLIHNGYDCCVVTGSHYDGNPENNCSHTWLSLDEETVVDITGDQFKYDKIFNFDVPVYIGKETSFHKLFDEDRLFEEPGIHLNDSIDRIERMQKIFYIISKNMAGE